MRRMLITGMLGIAVLSLGSGLANGLDARSDTLGAGTAPVPRCDTDGVTVTHAYSTFYVSSVTVADIAAACAGQRLDVTYDTGTTMAFASGTVPAGGGSMTLSFTPLVIAATSMRFDVVIRGT